MQVVREITPESRIPAFVEPRTSCPYEIAKIATNIAKNYDIPIRHKEDYVEDEEQVVIINMNTEGYPEFLKKLVTNGGRGVKALVVEQYNHKLPENFELVFKKNIIDLSDKGEISPNIIREDLAPELQRKISQIVRRRNEEKSEKQIEEILHLQLEEKKPRKRVLTPARKFLLKEKLLEYGNLEDVLKALSE